MMRILPPTPDAIAEALSILRSGGVVAHATETCYGFACDLTNPHAPRKLFVIKDRPFGQPVSALFPSVEDAKRYVEWDVQAQELASEHLPGPLTLILPLRTDAPHQLYPMPPREKSKIKHQKSSNRPLSIVHCHFSSLGIRISSHPLARQLAETFGRPISTTSGNVHGQPNPYSAADIVTQFQERNLQPDLILDSGELPRVPPSAVIDLTTGDEGMVLRGGTSIG